MAEAIEAFAGGCPSALASDASGRTKRGESDESAEEAPYWDGIGKRWIRQRPQRLWRRQSRDQQISLLAAWPLLPAGSALLKTDPFDEVGEGALVPWLLSRGLRVSGIDLSAAVVAEALQRCPGLEARVAEVRRLPFSSASFAMVFSGSTLDHFASATGIDRSLAECTRVLEPGGRLLVTLDNGAHSLILLRNGVLQGVLRRLGLVRYHVGTMLGPSQLRCAVEAAGLEVKELTPVSHAPRVLAVAMCGLITPLPRWCQQAAVASLQLWEGLERLPTRWFTGH